ncbi:MAG: hypothetical protein WAS27_00380, partial [Candidatus Saccharimonadales bacterium]
KRPLGTASNVSTDDTPGVKISVASGTGIMADRALPAELNTDVLALESEEDRTDDAKGRVVEQELGNIPVTEGVIAIASVPPDETEPDSAAGAIQTEIPASTDEVVESEDTSPVDTSKEGDATPEGTIYDVSEYHKPIEHQVKHGHEWLWVTIVIVIVVVCAVGAAAFYLLGAR